MLKRKSFQVIECRKLSKVSAPSCLLVVPFLTYLSVCTLNLLNARRFLLNFGYSAACCSPHFPSLLLDDAAEQVPDLSYLWPLAPSWILSIRGQWTPLLTLLLRIEFIGSKLAARMDFSPFTSPFCHGIYSRPLLDAPPNQCSIVPVIIYCPGVYLFAGGNGSCFMTGYPWIAPPSWPGGR